MIMTQRKMCRESRKVFEFLDDLAVKNGVQGIITPAHLCICDMLTCSFYTQAIINVMKNKLTNIGKKTSHHFEITYWDSIVRTMLNDKGAMRNNNIPKMLQGDSYDMLNTFMITDYGVDDATMILMVASKYNQDKVRHACNIASSAGVYNIQYINAVLERDLAHEQLVVMKIDNLAIKIEKSDKLLKQDIKQHSSIDIAMAQYEYQRKIEDYELEKKMNQLIGGNY